MAAAQAKVPEGQSTLAVEIVMLQRVVKLHYNWTYLRPSVAKVVERYNQKWPRGTKAGPSAATAEAVAEAAAAAVAAAGGP